MKRYLFTGLAILMVLAMILISGCGGGGSSTTTTATTSASPTSSASVPGFTAAAVGKGEPYKLVFLTQPGNAKAFEDFGTPPVVGIQDSDSNIVTSATLAISVSITPATAGSSPLSGTMQVNAVNGIATFPKINIQGGGKGFIMVAKSSGLQNGFSQPFDVAE